MVRADRAALQVQRGGKLLVGLAVNAEGMVGPADRLANGGLGFRLLRERNADAPGRPVEHFANRRLASLVAFRGDHPKHVHDEKVAHGPGLPGRPVLLVFRLFRLEHSGFGEAPLGGFAAQSGLELLASLLLALSQGGVLVGQLSLRLGERLRPVLGRVDEQECRQHGWRSPGPRNPP